MPEITLWSRAERQHRYDPFCAGQAMMINFMIGPANGHIRATTTASSRLYTADIAAGTANFRRLRGLKRVLGRNIVGHFSTSSDGRLGAKNREGDTSSISY